MDDRSNSGAADDDKGACSPLPEGRRDVFNPVVESLAAPTRTGLLFFCLWFSVLIGALFVASSAHAVTADTQAILDALGSVQLSVVGSSSSQVAGLAAVQSSVVGLASVASLGTAAQLDSLAAVQSSVVSLAALTSSVAVVQGFDVPALISERSVLILFGGMFAFFYGFGITKGYR